MLPLSDPLFKGCTRPAMFFGVPLVPLMVVGAVLVLLSVWITLWIAPFLLPLFLVMRLLCAQDDQQFRLLYFRLKFRVFHFDATRKAYRASVYAPSRYERRDAI